MAGRIKEVNNIPQILDVMNELERTKLQIGIFAEEGSELFIIAMVNEYGTSIKVTQKMRAYLHYQGLHLKASTTHIKIPERSFIRSGFEYGRKDIEDVVEKALPLVLSLRLSPDEFYKLVGEMAVGKIHEYIQQLDSPPNHPFTVKGKGSSHPLIDTGRLNQSITYRVVKE